MVREATGAHPEYFQDRVGSVKLGHLNKHFVKIQ